jgi:hypothetical protein
LDRLEFLPEAVGAELGEEIIGARGEVGHTE